MSDVLSTPQAAAYIGLGASTLEKWRVFGTGPKFIRLGTRRVGYHRRDLDAWLAARPRLASTSEVSRDSDHTSAGAA
jgi:predicted DNA-binding transcriptional regulator AlpA